MMEFGVVKKSLEYCLANKKFFAFILLLLFILEYALAFLDHAGYVSSAIVLVFLTGYGLVIIKDVINGGTRLPKIEPLKIFDFGIKGYAVRLVYILVQFFLLGIIAVNLNFPEFDVEEILLELPSSLNIFVNHDIVSCIIFILSGFIIVYVTTFFMELTLARIADNGSVKSVFQLREIWHIIDIIGLRKYTVAYSKIILAIFFLTFVSRLFNFVQPLDIVVNVICDLLIFVIEFIGMAEIYKVYINKK